MSKLLSLANPFAAFGSKTVAVPKTTASIAFTPSKARTINTAVRGRAGVLGARQQALQQYAVYGMVALNVLLLVGYVISVNASASAGYEITKLQRTVSRLTEDSKKLTLENAEINSMMTIHDSLNREGFVPVVSAEYIQLETKKLTQR
jgi:hypothetical protein